MIALSSGLAVRTSDMSETTHTDEMTTVACRNSTSVYNGVYGDMVKPWGSYMGKEPGRVG